MGSSVGKEVDASVGSLVSLSTGEGVGNALKYIARLTLPNAIHAKITDKTKQMEFL